MRHGSSTSATAPQSSAEISKRQQDCAIEVASNAVATEVFYTGTATATVVAALRL